MTASTIAPAPPPPPLLPGQLPIAILVDYDGTVAQTDVSDALMAEFVTGECGQGGRLRLGRGSLGPAGPGGQLETRRTLTQ